MQPFPELDGVVLNQRYMLQSVLDTDSFTVRYRAGDRKTGQACVIKVLSLKLAGQWKNTALLKQEAVILKRLNHPNIPAYRDFFIFKTKKDIYHCLVQTYIEGKTLAKHIAEGQPFSEHEVMRIGIAVCDILQYLHTLSPPIILRNLNPNTLLLTEQNQVFLTDFSAVCANMVDETEKNAGNGAGSTIIGNDGYTPYEQFSGQAVVESDIYALGASLVYLLSRQQPAKLKKTGLQLDFQSKVKVSPLFTQLLRKMLEPKWRKRYRQAIQVKQHLQALLAGKIPWGLRNTVWLRPVGAVLWVGLVALGLYVWLTWSEQAPTPTLVSDQLIPLDPKVRANWRKLGTKVPDIEPISLQPWVAGLKPQKIAFSVTTPVEATQRAAAQRLASQVMGMVEQQQEWQHNFWAVPSVADPQQLSRTILLLSVAAWQIADIPETREALLQAVQLVSSYKQPLLYAHRLKVHSRKVNCLAYKPDGKVLVSGSHDHSIRVWDTETGHSKGLIAHQSPVTVVAFSPNGKRIAAGDQSGVVTLWDATHNTLIDTSLVGHQQALTGMAFTPDNQRLFTSSKDASVIVWDVNYSLRKTKLLDSEHTGSINALALSADGRLLVTGGNTPDFHTELVFWDATTAAPIIKFMLKSFEIERPGHVRQLLFTADARKVILVRDERVQFWDVLARQLSTPFKTWYTTHNAALSTNNLYFATSHTNGQISLWDLTNNTHIGKQLRGHTDNKTSEDTVNSVAFSPDGKYLASAGDDGRVIIWYWDPLFWAKKACQLAQDDFNREEWNRMVGDEFPYRENCLIMQQGLVASAEILDGTTW